MRLTGGFDARLYRYKLVSQEPRVLRILRPECEVEELMYHQLVHRTLNQQGLKSPVIHHVCGDQSVLGGVFVVMDPLAGQIVFGLTPALHAKVLGDSVESMHGLDVRPIVESLRRACVQDESYLILFKSSNSSKGVGFFEKKTPLPLTLFFGFAIICLMIVRILQ